MKRRTFKLNQQNKTIDEEEIINKGGEVYEVDIDSLRVTLRQLRTKAGTPINNLTGQDKKNFETIVNYVNCFYTSGNYESLHQVIREEFSGMDRLTPGTIGAYMVGSIASPDPCYPLSVNSAPASSNHRSCEERVILGSISNGGYTFTDLNNINSDKAILYLPGVFSETFNGLSPSEKEDLKKLSVSEVNIKGYIGGKQNDVTRGYKSLEIILTREGPLIAEPISPAPVASPRSSFNLAFLLLIIIIILILVFVAWKVWA